MDQLLIPEWPYMEIFRAKNKDSKRDNRLTSTRDREFESSLQYRRTQMTVWITSEDQLIRG